MIPIQQREVSSGLDGERPGDCFKCCIASILELPYEAVPHFVAGDHLVDYGTGQGPKKTGFQEAFNDWLLREGWPLRYETQTYFKAPAPEGKGIPYIDYLDKFAWPKRSIPGFWVASVLSSNFPGMTHAVVMLESAVAYDPSPRLRRVPYVFVGEGFFVPTNAALFKPAPIAVPIEVKKRTPPKKRAPARR